MVPDHPPRIGRSAVSLPVAAFSGAGQGGSAGAGVKGRYGAAFAFCLLWIGVLIEIESKYEICLFFP